MQKFITELEGLSTILNNLLDGLIIINRQGHIRLINQRVIDMFGYSEAEMLGENVSILMPREHAEEHDHYIQRYLDTGEAHVIGVGREVDARRKDGTLIPVNLAITEAYFEGELHFIGTLRDLTLQRQADKTIEELAHYDSVTGLPNRTLMLEELKGYLEKRDVAIIMLNLDYFNRINVVFGYQEGKRVLKEVANRLQIVAENDEFIAKDIEDKFWIICRNVRNSDERAVKRAEAFVSCIKDPIHTEGTEHHLSASAGVTMSRRGSLASRELANADSAAQEAKRKGRDQVSVYRKVMTSRVIDDYQIETGLRKALKKGGIQCWLQSKVNAKGELSSAEALVRWETPDGRTISPNTFLPVAERFGLIGDIGWVVARKVAQSLRIACVQRPDFRIAMNVSPRQFLAPKFQSGLRQVFNEESAPLHNLTIEITEHLLSMEPEYVETLMKELSADGVEFSIDDFGTGYSNLNRLRKLPLHELKIDKAFVDEIGVQADRPTGELKAPLLDTILMMANALGLNTVAEGVETKQQSDYLVARSCNELQGFLYAKPVEINQWLEINGFDANME